MLKENVEFWTNLDNKEFPCWKTALGITFRFLGQGTPDLEGIADELAPKTEIKDLVVA